MFKEKYRGTEREYLFIIRNPGPYVMRKEAQRDSEMKPYYDRLANYIFKKSKIDFRSPKEEDKWEDQNLPDDEPGPPAISTKR